MYFWQLCDGNRNKIDKIDMEICNTDKTVKAKPRRIKIQ